MDNKINSEIMYHQIEPNKEETPLQCQGGPVSFQDSEGKMDYLRDSVQGEENITMNPVSQKDISLDRKSNLRSSLFVIGFGLLMEMMKQLSIFELSSSNGGEFPLPMTLLVVITEATKLVVTLTITLFSGTSIKTFHISGKFCIPAFCYFVANLLYLRALTITAPPIWTILIQPRTLYTAVVYWVMFKKEVTKSQWLGCLLIVISIPLTKVAELRGGHFSITGEVLFISQITALLSTIASIAIEVYLKNDHRTFLEQQTWLYLFGTLMGLVTVGITLSAEQLANSWTNLQSNTRNAELLVISVVASTFNGLTIPIIVKNLDSIVKDYLAALDNILLSILTAVIFPDHFSINETYAVSLFVLLIGISFYEKRMNNCFIT